MPNKAGTMTVADTGRTFEQAMSHNHAFNTLSGRHGFRWVAGQRGKPSLNADIQNAAEATRMIADPDFEVLGTNMTSALSTFNAEGGIKLTTAGADDDQAILLPHLDANQSGWAQTTWGTDQQTRWEAVIETGASIANYHLWAGLKLTNTSTLGTDNDQAFFRFNVEDTDSTVFQIVYSIGGTDTQKPTEVVVAASTRYYLVIEIDEARVARFYINNVLVYTSTALTDAIDLIPYIGVQALTGAAKSVVVYGEAISRKAGA